MASEPAIKIEGLKVRAVSLPMADPHRTSNGVITESPLVLIDVITDAGVHGHSMVFTYNAEALKPTAEMIKNLEPLIKGERLAPAEIEQNLAKRFRLLGTQGLVGFAIAGIDMALWDAFSRAQNRSLVNVLGGVHKPVKPYGAVGFDGVSGCAEEAEKWAKRGFKGIKAKIGYPTVQEDVDVLRSMRSAVGDDMAIMVDYNQFLSPADAVERIRILDSEGLTWAEEPTLAHDYAGHAHVSRLTNTPIQCGENWWGTQDMRHSIDACASDFVMIDVMKIGGITGWLRASTLAHTHNLRMSSHLWPETSAQLLCCTPTAHWLEYTDWWNVVLQEPLQIQNGMAFTEGATGTGVSWNEEIISRYLI